MAKSSRLDDTFVEFVCDQLEGLDGVAHKSMFGGYGIYAGAIFFAIVYRDQLYFKTDESTRGRYEEWGSQAFQPNSKQKLKSYYQVPADLIEDMEELLALAVEALDVAART